MQLVASDILFLMSGGSFNQDAANSLGGEPSNVAIGTSVNNLFTPITRKTTAGTDYRCLYVLNNHDTDSYTDIEVWMEQVGSTVVSIGIQRTNEIQQISLRGSPIGGTFAIRFTKITNGNEVIQTTDPIQWVPILTTMAMSIADALNSLTFLGGVQVVAARPSATEYTYTITFAGTNANQQQEQLIITNNQILGDDIVWTETTLQNGSPLNNIAASVGFPNQAPSGVNFTVPLTPEEAIPVGDLGPGDFFPIWVQRTLTQSEIDAMLEEEAETVRNGVRLRVTGRAIHVSF